MCSSSFAAPISPVSPHNCGWAAPATVTPTVRHPDGVTTTRGAGPAAGTNVIR
jgi:hypothetical protein